MYLGVVFQLDPPTQTVIDITTKAGKAGWRENFATEKVTSRIHNTTRNLAYVKETSSSISSSK